MINHPAIGYPISMELPMCFVHSVQIPKGKSISAHGCGLGLQNQSHRIHFRLNSRFVRFNKGSHKWGLHIWGHKPQGISSYPMIMVKYIRLLHWNSWPRAGFRHRWSWKKTAKMKALKKGPWSWRTEGMEGSGATSEFLWLRWQKNTSYNIRGKYGRSQLGPRQNF